MRSLHIALMRVARLQGNAYNPLELQDAINVLTEAEKEGSPDAILTRIMEIMSLPVPNKIFTLDPALVPVLVYEKSKDWGVLKGLNALENWVVEFFEEGTQEWVESVFIDLDGFDMYRLTLERPFHLQGNSVFQLIRQEILSHKKLLLEAALGGVVINLIALASSFYSMQVYDRVMPTGSMKTLFVLTMAVFFSAFLEFFAKIARGKLYEKMLNATDAKLSRAVFLRFLSIRLDQMPRGVGSIAGQLRGYETVRGFLTTMTTQILVDLPFAIIFLIIIAQIGGGMVLIPLTFLAMAIGLGFLFRASMEHSTSKATSSGNSKMGILVESIEGAETIKSGHAGWRVLSKWIAVNDEGRVHESRIRQVSEQSQYVVAMFQQLGYVVILVVGAIEVSRGAMTTGVLVAVSMLMGRVLAPVAGIPTQLVHWGHAKAALAGLDRIWNLKDDHHGIPNPIQLQDARGHYIFEKVQTQYMLSPALIIERLEIKPGERVGVIGSIGAGKTTLLRLLSGMYKPQVGRVLFDGVDMAHISKPILAEKIGYLQQDGRLFAGTLRENLILGMHDPGDDEIFRVANMTGLMNTVISPNSNGLHQEIAEGGIGLSGGQRQLVNLTRVFLRKPSIWLLDEPTASMDRALESQVLAALTNSLEQSDTLVVVTHKTELLALVDRIILVSNHQVILDGPKGQVLQAIHDLQKQQAAQVGAGELG